LKIKNVTYYFYIFLNYFKKAFVFGINHASGHYFAVFYGLRCLKLWWISGINEPDVLKFIPLDHILTRISKNNGPHDDLRLRVMNICFFR